MPQEVRSLETIELIRIACYALNAISCFTLAVYFVREFFTKRLRPSLAWAVGFGSLGVAIIAMAMTTMEVSKSVLTAGFLLSTLTAPSLYYGASLLFFKEGSFFREKFTVIFYLVVLIVGLTVIVITPVEYLVERLTFIVQPIYLFAYLVIGILFLQVSRRLPTNDPRRRTITLVAAAWGIISFWVAYVLFFLYKYIALEAVVFLIGSVGFLLLLYGMTTGKTSKK
jgi:hypothetical protein